MHVGNRDYYGNETVTNAHSGRSLTLSGTTVKSSATSGWGMQASNVKAAGASLSSGRALTATDTQFGSAKSCWEAIFINCLRSGNASSGRALTATNCGFTSASSNWESQLTNCTVEYTADSGRALTAQNCTLGGAKSNWGMTISGGSTEFATAGRKLTLTQAKVSAAASASWALEATRCPSIGSVKSGRSTTLNHCPSVGSVVADWELSMDTSTVNGNATGRKVDLLASQVIGKLTLSGEENMIKNSTVGSIVAKKPAANLGNISIGGFNFGNCSVGGDVIINGVSMRALAQKAQQQQSSDSEPEPQIITLDGSTVKGDVVFEEGNGILILKNDAKVDLDKVSGAEVKDSSGKILKSLASKVAKVTKTIPAANEISEDCDVCLKNRINAVAVPCGHQAFCLECLKDLDFCTICGSEITQAVKVLND